MKRIIFSFLLTVLFASPSQGAGLKNQAEIDLLLFKVMALAGEGKTAQGLELIRPYVNIPEAEFNVAIAQLKQQQPEMTQRFGKTIGTEKIKSEVVGESFMKITFLQKFEEYAMKWEIFFYKATDEWTITKYTVNDQISTLFTK